MRHKHAEMIPIDEQIAYLRKHIDDDCTRTDIAILASLERLKAIDAVPVPDEPENWMMVEYLVDGEHRKPCHLRVVSKMSYDTLRDLLRRESARADYNGGEWAKSAEGIVALQSKLAELELTNKLANKMMEELK